MNPPAENPAGLVERVAGHVKARFASEGSGHDWHHIHRVWKLVQQIGEAEGADAQVTSLGALLHDIADWKFHGGDDAVGPREAERLLVSEGAPRSVIEPVVEIVATISFKGAGVKNAMRSLEGKCVQDADRLDIKRFGYHGLSVSSAIEALWDAGKRHNAARAPCGQCFAALHGAVGYCDLQRVLGSKVGGCQLNHFACTNKQDADGF